MSSNLTNQDKQTVQKVASEVKGIIDFLKHHKIVKTQKKIAEDLGIDEATISRSSSPILSVLSTAEKVRDKMLYYYDLVISDGVVLFNKNEEKKNNVERERSGNLKIESHLVGTYQLQWKKVNYSLHVVANIRINPDGSVLFMVEDELFKGTAIIVKTMLRLELKKNSEIGILSEIFDLSFDIGNTHSPLKYIGGIIKAVENRMTMLYGAFCLLIREDNVPVNQEIIDTFFAYTQSKNCLEFDDNIKQILDPRQDIMQTKQKMPELNANYCPLKGKWDCILKIELDTGTGIRVGKLNIINNNNVLYTGISFSNYQNGEVVITGGYDLYIYLRGGHNLIFIDNQIVIHFKNSYLKNCKKDSVFRNSCFV